MSEPITDAEKIEACDDCRADQDVVETMELIALGELAADSWLCPEHLEVFERGTAEYAVGTRDLDEADRRMNVIDEWHRERTV